MPLSDVGTRWRRDRSAVRLLPASLTSGRSPAQVPMTSLSVERLADRVVDGAEQVGDVVGRALRVVDGAVVVGVGGADVGDRAGRHRAVVARHGTTKTERRSLGTGTTAAMSLRTLCHGTVMWMPLAGRMVSGWVPSSRARTSSAHTPVALTTTRADTSTCAAVGARVDVGTRHPVALLA